MRITITLMALAVAGFVLTQSVDARQRRSAPVHSFSVVATFPHDPKAFTQGLVFADGEFFESTGLQGESSLRRVEVTSGKVLQEIKVPNQYFAEGLALVGDELLQLTWQDHTGFVYDRKTFKQKRSFPYKQEGWGIAYDGQSQLVMSDGSDRLFFLDPKTQALVRTVRVQDAGSPVPQLNELEWVEDEIWANVWTTDRIARISPTTGDVVAWINLDRLWPRARRTANADVLNGIAYDKRLRRIFVTGKKWPNLYQIAVGAQ